MAGFERQWAFMLATAALVALAGCGGDDPVDISVVPPSTGTGAPAPTPTPAAISSLGADGWASTGAGTTGGNGADSSRVFIVRNRTELVQALYGGSAVIAEDGSVTGTPDTSPKILYVQGRINLNVNRALVEQTADDYVRTSCANATYGFTTEAALWAAYYAAYRPSVWGRREVTGTQEAARVCAQQQQARVIRITVPSNTSIIGQGADAKIVNGSLAIGNSINAPAQNVVIRNIAFEDAFDFFPVWDPLDSTGRWNSAYDLVSIGYATNVWVDHSTFSDGARTDDRYPSVWTETVGGVDFTGSDFKVQHHDGLVDINRNGDRVTVSNNLLFDHDKVSLVGGTDTPSLTAENPRALRVTYHSNIFRNLRQRLPRVRYGQVHIYNNYFEGSRTGTFAFMAAWTAGQSSKIYAENNVFQIPGATVENLYAISISAAQTTRCGQLGFTAAECAVTFFDSGTILNGAGVDITTAIRARNSLIGATAWQPSSFYTYAVQPTNGLAARLATTAGAGKL